MQVPSLLLPQNHISGRWQLEEIITSHIPFYLDFIGLAPIYEPDTKSSPIVINFKPQLGLSKAVTATLVTMFERLFTGHKPTVFLIAKSLD